MLAPLLGAGDFLLNLSVDVSSVALFTFAREIGALYLDTCIEPWAGGYTDPALTPSQRSNYALRESAIALRGPARPDRGADARRQSGAGLALLKEALLIVAADTGLDAPRRPRARTGRCWRERLGVKAVHIAERDTQTANRAKEPGEFVNTWSIDGFVGEGCQPAELGWGTHESALPVDARRHDFGCDAAIYLLRPAPPRGCAAGRRWKARSTAS